MPGIRPSGETAGSVIAPGKTSWPADRTPAPVAIDPAKGPGDIVSPGQVFPLVARGGGVLVRAGHTEASVDVACPAGLTPAAVICEIMNDDGSVARPGELEAFARTHSLKFGAAQDLTAHGLVTGSHVERVLEAPFPYGGAEFRLVLFRNKVDGIEHAVLVHGDVSGGAPTLACVHRLDMAGHAIGAIRERGVFFDRAMAEIVREGRGVMVLVGDFTPGWVTGARLSVSAQPAAVSVIGARSRILRGLGLRQLVLPASAPAQAGRS